MILARVQGTVSRPQGSRTAGLKLLLVREVDVQFKPSGGNVVAADAVGAGEGDIVMVVAAPRRV